MLCNRNKTETLLCTMFTSRSSKCNLKLPQHFNLGTGTAGQTGQMGAADSESDDPLLVEAFSLWVQNLHQTSHALVRQGECAQLPLATRQDGGTCHRMKDLHELF